MAIGQRRTKRDGGSPVYCTNYSVDRHISAGVMGGPSFLAPALDRAKNKVTSVYSYVNGVQRIKVNRV